MADDREPGTCKSHIAIAIARACIRGGRRGRFFNVVDLINKTEAESRAGRRGWIADHLSRLDFIVLDELDHLHFAQSDDKLPSHLISRLYKQSSVIALQGSRERRLGRPRGPSFERQASCAH